MSELELKGGIVQLVSKLRNRESLKELKELIELFVRNHASDTDFWDVEKSELNRTLAESQDDKNLVSHQEVMNKYKKWLNQ